MSDFLLVPVIVSLTQFTVTYSTTLIPPYQLKYNYTVADSRIESWSYRDFVEGWLQFSPVGKRGFLFEGRFVNSALLCWDAGFSFANVAEYENADLSKRA